MPHKIKETILKIRKRRISLNYSQEYMATKMSISQNAYSKIEIGKSNLTVKRLYQISNILLVPPMELLAES